MSKRNRIRHADQQQIVFGLESRAQSGSFLALRTRAFTYLLWDGALRTQAALALDARDVAASPEDGIPDAIERANPRSPQFRMRVRTRNALSKYLQAARLNPAGPLWVSHRTPSIRVSRQTVAHSWRRSLSGLLLSQPYTLDDLVYTGRLHFLKAAGGNTELLAKHAGITPSQASRYRQPLRAWRLDNPPSSDPSVPNCPVAQHRQRLRGAADCSGIR